SCCPSTATGRAAAMGTLAVGAGAAGTGAGLAWARLSRASRTAVAAKPPKAAAAVRAMSEVARRMQVPGWRGWERRHHGGGRARHQAERVSPRGAKPAVKPLLTCAFHLFRTPPPGSPLPPLL